MRTVCHHKHEYVVVLMTTLFSAFFFLCVCQKFNCSILKMSLTTNAPAGPSWWKAPSLGCLLGSPSVRAELMAQTRLFALGICLWHTYSRLEHMLHACHSPRKRSGSETFTLTWSTFIAPIHQRVEDEKKKKKKKRSLRVQVCSLIVSYVFNFDDYILARLVFGNSGCLL